MWFRSQRNNPLSRHFSENSYYRPILPQDETWDYFSYRFTDYEMIYIWCNLRKVKSGVLYANNVPVYDREKMKSILSTYFDIRESLYLFAIPPAALTTGLLLKTFGSRMRHKIFYPMTAVFTFLFYKKAIQKYSYSFFNDNMSYYCQKYSHMLNNKLNDIKDPRRQFFYLDTSQYQRKPEEQVPHGGHQASGHDHEGEHESETYYGPFPVSHR